MLEDGAVWVLDGFREADKYKTAKDLAHANARLIKIRRYPGLQLHLTASSPLSDEPQKAITILIARRRSPVEAGLHNSTVVGGNVVVCGFCCPSLNQHPNDIVMSTLTSDLKSRQISSCWSSRLTGAPLSINSLASSVLPLIHAPINA